MPVMLLWIQYQVGFKGGVAWPHLIFFFFFKILFTHSWEEWFHTFPIDISRHSTPGFELNVVLLDWLSTQSVLLLYPLLKVEEINASPPKDISAK